MGQMHGAVAWGRCMRLRRMHGADAWGGCMGRSSGSALAPLPLLLPAVAAAVAAAGTSAGAGTAVGRGTSCHDAGIPQQLCQRTTVAIGRPFVILTGSKLSSLVCPKASKGAVNNLAVLLCFSACPPLFVVCQLEEYNWRI